jgi:hypothetical protein
MRRPERHHLPSKANDNDLALRQMHKLRKNRINIISIFEETINSLHTLEKPSDD